MLVPLWTLEQVQGEVAVEVQAPGKARSLSLLKPSVALGVVQAWRGQNAGNLCLPFTRMSLVMLFFLPLSSCLEKLMQWSAASWNLISWNGFYCNYRVIALFQATSLWLCWQWPLRSRYLTLRGGCCANGFWRPVFAVSAFLLLWLSLKEDFSC